MVLWIFCSMFLHVEWAPALWSFVLFFPACWMCSVIVEFSVLFFFVWNALCYCGFSCYIFPLMKIGLLLLIFVLYFSACGIRSGIMEFCDILSGCETRSIIVEFHVIFFCIWNALWYFWVLCYKFLNVERSLIFLNFYYLFCPVMCSCCLRVVKKLKMLCCIFPRWERALLFCVIFFPRVEGNLVLCVTFFCLQNALYYFVLYSYMCVTRCGVLCCIVLCVEHALVISVAVFHVWNALWYFVLNVLLFLSSFHVVLYLPWFTLFFVFSASLKLSLMYTLWYCGILCYIYSHFERALIFLKFLWYCEISCYIFPRVERALVLWDFLLYLFSCEMHSCIADFCVIFFCVWNARRYCGIFCYFFLRVERALLLWDFVLYTFSMWSALCYCRISCYILPIMLCLWCMWVVIK